MLQLSDKQKEFIQNANKRYNIKTGATRSGKTYLDILYTIPSRIRERSGKDGLNVILGVTNSTIERNILQPLRELYGDKLVGTINSHNVARLFGEEVYCLGAEKVSQVSKIRGASIKYCYCDELAEYNQEVFELLKSRLDKEYSVLDGALNPESPTHWLKQFIDSDVDIYCQTYTIFDNPFLPPQFSALSILLSNLANACNVVLPISKHSFVDAYLASFIHSKNLLAISSVSILPFSTIESIVASVIDVSSDQVPFGTL